jgi:hypothetical protein
MKNLHLIQTEKPTGLFESQSGVLHYSIMNKVRTGLLKGYHIYITSDEEIKEDWILIIDDFETYVHKHKGDNLPTTYHKKIILTTDPDLIVDGVQAIDGEFSEWFVKNPSCEEVKTRKIGKEWIYNADVPQEDTFFVNHVCGTQEEPKPEYQSECICENSCRGFVNVKCKQLKKRESLEEAALFYAKQVGNVSGTGWVYDAVKFGAKWLAQRSYSEEEVLELLSKRRFDLKFKKDSKTTKEWFEQHKKK